MNSCRDYIKMSGNYEKTHFSDVESSYEIYQSTTHPLTEKMKQSIKLAIHCFDDQVCFVILGDDVMMVLAPEDPIDFDEFESYLHESHSSAIWPPDFNIMKCEDDAFIVWMKEFICIRPNTDNSQELVLGKALDYRQSIIDAYDNMNIYGIAIGKHFE